MKLLFITSPSLLILIALFLWLRFGAFSAVQIERGLAGGETVVYEEGRGDYRKSGELMDRVYHRLIETESIETNRGFGLFYDNPKEVEKQQLRYEAGCILDAEHGTIEDLKDSFKVRTIQQGECLIAEHPYKGRLSILLGTMRVYPAFEKYIRTHNLPQGGAVMEIYDVPGKKIVYRKFL